MNEFTVQNSAGVRIESVSDWGKLAPPFGGEFQWKDGRSAKELAKAWFRKGTALVPDEITALMDSDPATRGFVPEVVIPEVRVQLDKFKGNTRNADLVLVGHVAERRVVASIEAKADESFGELLSQYSRKALDKNPRSKVPQRVELLLAQMFAPEHRFELGGLRYQLLHAAAATLIEAARRGAHPAVFVVHEFKSPRLDERKLKRNANDFAQFVRSFPELSSTMPSTGRLVGPIRVPGGAFISGGIDLFIGKVVTEIG